MNVYFLIEGEVTESLAYPFWMSQMVPQFEPVDFFNKASTKNYYVFCGGGIPSIYNHITNAIRDINDHPVYTHFVICIDGEEVGYEMRRDIVLRKIEESGVTLNSNCELKIIVQNPCIETWFLGNQRFFKHQPQGEKLRGFIQHYNVCHDDPELMETKSPYRGKAPFHFAYLREIFNEYDESYSKRNPRSALNSPFFDRMQDRINSTPHLASFRELIEFLEGIEAERKARGI